MKHISIDNIEYMIFQYNGEWDIYNLHHFASPSIHDISNIDIINKINIPNTYALIIRKFINKEEIEKIIINENYNDVNTKLQNIFHNICHTSIYYINTYTKDTNTKWIKINKQYELIGLSTDNNIYMNIRWKYKNIVIGKNICIKLNKGDLFIFSLNNSKNTLENTMYDYIFTLENDEINDNAYIEYSIHKIES